MSEFKGFEHEMQDFLFELQFNNTMENLPQNKIRYKSLISEPLHLLYNEIHTVATSINSSIETKPSRCISGMYNDMRFSRGTPLKTYMYLRFREMNGDTDMLGLYFDMGLEGYSYGIRIYKQTSAGMAAIREKVLKNQIEFSKSLLEIKKSGVKIIGQSYKKDHYPDIKNKKLNSFLNLRSFYICFDKTINENVFCNKLADEIASGLIKLKEFYTLLKGESQ
ncbi:MAG TPA: DUF2461 family protein [Clostridia bacterium]|nr:DUF2461 family protein [Clostridia bacterium]